MHGKSDGGGHENRRFCCVVFAAIAVVVFASAESQSGCASPVGNSKSSLSSLVGDTMSSANDVPFEWSPEYEIAVVFITSMWSEFEKPGGSLAVQTIVAKNGFLNYCVRFKNKLDVFAKYLQDDPDVKMSVKKAVANWYKALVGLSQNGWNLTDTPSLQSIKTQFRTAYKHLVINANEIYGLSAIGETQQREVDEFTKEIARMMIEILKEISKQIRNVPVKSGPSSV